MQEYTVTRDGQKDLRFSGELLVEANNKWVAGRENNRWHELSLYRTTGGKYVLQEVYRTQWQGEIDRHGAAVYGTAEEVLDALTCEDGGLSDLDKELLQRAAKADPGFASLWTETLE
jgi:hypothetical protein